MVTKIISCADIHFKSLKGIEDLKNVLKTFFEDCRKIVDKEGLDNVRIVVAGDIFDAKINITNESLLAVYWFFSELNKICKTIVIAGNHDFLMHNTDRVDSLTPLFEIGKLDNVVYLDKELGYKSGFYKDDNIVWCLYSCFDGFTSPSVKMAKTTYKDENCTYVGLVHGDVNGAITATNFTKDNGLDPNIFEDCNFVIAGHIHKFQEIKKNGVPIVYCSDMVQKDEGETISEHGYVLWDVKENGDFSYQFYEVPNPEGGYFKFEIQNIADIENDEEELINL